MPQAAVVDPEPIDVDTAIVGLTAIGTRLYEDAGEGLPEGVFAAEHAVFARHFDPLWRALTNDDRRWLREKLDHEDGVFDRLVADYESRTAASDARGARLLAVQRSKAGREEREIQRALGSTASA